MDKVELLCRRCSQRPRVPSALGDLRLTCPGCRYSWDEPAATIRCLAFETMPPNVAPDRGRERTPGDKGVFPIHGVEQRSKEWFELRRGIPTASQFCKIITSRGSESRQAEAYLAALLAELADEEYTGSFTGSYWTERGTNLEEEAVRRYEQVADTNTVKVGFITDRSRTMGCSPDRLVDSDGLLEVKCPAPHTHGHYLRRQRIDMRYYPQVQGQLLITGRSWVDFFSYDPDQPHFRVRVFRDEPYIATLRLLLHKFVRELQRRRGEASGPTGAVPDA